MATLAKSRTRRAVLLPLTEEEAKERMRSYADATSKIKEIEAELEQEIANLRGAKEGMLTELNNIRQQAAEALQQYALTHKSKLFSNKKSLELDHGVIGFRLGTPKVIKATRETWAVLFDRLKVVSKRFVKKTEAVNKEAIIDSRDNKVVIEQLSLLGVSVVQQEAFFCESYEQDLRKN